MFNDKIPQQGTTDLRRDIHDSWVFLIGILYAYGFSTTSRGQLYDHIPEYKPYQTAGIAIVQLINKT